MNKPAGESGVIGRFGLSARLLMLTLLFVMLAVVCVSVPSVANYRVNWLTNRVSGAVTAAMVLEAAPNGMVSEKLAMQVLDSIGAKTVVLKMKDSRRLLAASDLPPQIDVTVDLRDLGWPDMIRQAFGTLTAPDGRIMRVMAHAPMNGEFIELTMPEAPLREAMLRFARNILLFSLAVAVITAGLVHLALSWLIVRPMRRLTHAMVAFGENPEDQSRIVEASSRTDEIGVAERELSAMQRQLAGALQQKNRLANLGLAVAKINHDLRNLLAAAQLFSDRLTDSDDPMVQRFAPKLLQTLDRAITFCQSTLSYGRAVEQPPQRRPVPVAPLVTDVRELLGLGGEDQVGWIESIEPDLIIDADPDQLSRVLLNLSRNALEALRGKGETDPAHDHIRVTGRRTGPDVLIEISDTGPGVPDKARQRLFEAFSGSARPGGTGLGLAIAAELVRAHGGTVALVDGTLGATFRIQIPDRTHEAP
ncbi:signal transduction histidine kinase [Labrys wisconsinensis]|uniref:histidine kinase n=2 Tax=Labrys wisconsinensis TaxID=425677 RepID=A0ABU0IZK6_9HYPH|nr:HAMP domain-containing sensor histidine kinase [Labrys wisconsinensis]MDQ0467450.1 signal transduction histidine kinase [Labrys wisconsinensis]